MLAGGSAAAAGLLAGCGGSTASGETAQFGGGDAGILNYFLSLEHREIAMYGALISSGQFQGSQLEMLRQFLGQEHEHVARLTKLLKRQGGEAAGQTQDELQVSGQSSTALAQAQQLEDLIANAYLGQLANIEDSAVLATALAIQSVEGRHAAAIAAARGTTISPDGAFAKPASARRVVRAVGSASGA